MWWGRMGGAGAGHPLLVGFLFPKALRVAILPHPCGMNDRDLRVPTCLHWDLAATHLVALFLGNGQVPLAAHDGLVEAAQDLECVAQVPAGLGFPHAVTDCPGGTAKSEG